MNELHIFKQDEFEIIPIESEEEVDYLSRCYGSMNVVYDMGRV